MTKTYTISEECPITGRTFMFREVDNDEDMAVRIAKNLSISKQCGVTVFLNDLTLIAAFDKGSSWER